MPEIGIFEIRFGCSCEGEKLNNKQKNYPSGIQKCRKNWIELSKLLQKVFKVKSKNYWNSPFTSPFSAKCHVFGFITTSYFLYTFTWMKIKTVSFFKQFVIFRVEKRKKKLNYSHVCSLFIHFLIFLSNHINLYNLKSVQAFDAIPGNTNKKYIYFHSSKSTKLSKLEKTQNYRNGNGIECVQWGFGAYCIIWNKTPLIIFNPWIGNVNLLKQLKDIVFVRTSHQTLQPCVFFRFENDDIYPKSILLFNSIIFGININFVA